MLRSVRRGTVGAPGPAGPLPVCAPYRCAGERGQPRFAVGETGARRKCFQHCSPGEQYGRPHREEACPCLPVSRGSITRGPWVTSTRMRPTQLGRPVTWPFQPGRCRDTALMDWRLRPSPRGGIAARRQRPSRLPPPPLPPPPLPPCESSSQSREPGGPGDTGPSLICLRLEAFCRGPASRPCQRTPTHVTESPPPGQSSQHRKPCTCTAVRRKRQVWGACSAGLVGVQSLSSALTATPDPAVLRARK